MSNRLLTRLSNDRRGSTAAEFAIVVPILVVGIFACIQFSFLFFANAGLQNAIGESSRAATLWPRKTPAQLTAQLNAAKFGLDPAKLAQPKFTYGKSGGQDYVDIEMTYETELDLGLFKTPAIKLTETRRTYLP